jgi:hypothetical protein
VKVQEAEVLRELWILLDAPPKLWLANGKLYNLISGELGYRVADNRRRQAAAAPFWLPASAVPAFPRHRQLNAYLTCQTQLLVLIIESRLPLLYYIAGTRQHGGSQPLEAARCCFANYSLDREARRAAIWRWR